MSSLGRALVGGSNNNTSTKQATLPGSVLSPSQYVQSGIVNVFVGRKRKEFAIYRDLLSVKSPFFAAKLKKDWNNDKNEIYLENEDPDAFSALVDWMFSGKLPDFYSERTTTSIASVTAFYKLADFLLMPTAKNDLIDHVVNHHRAMNRHYTFHHLSYVWGVHAVDKPFLKMVLHSIIKNLVVRTDDVYQLEYLREYPDLMLLVIRYHIGYNKRPWARIWENPRCDYHDHSDGSKCVPKL
ncbi:hypothetical protein LTR64_001915 [Lithohypha guttulata]|uniref:uncharacterized protein n=1 Tax=Lithohypha guttulata TaxID=1690604 RepID=UPI002DE10A25|nr:hypothetical protein LTR51_007774 [Lithohypha guttulata]